VVGEDGEDDELPVKLINTKYLFCTFSTFDAQKKKQENFSKIILLNFEKQNNGIIRKYSSRAFN